MSRVASETITAILDNPKVAANIAGATAVIGGTSMIEQVQSYAALAATLAGLLLSCILIARHGLGLYREWRSGSIPDGDA